MAVRRQEYRQHRIRNAVHSALLSGASMLLGGAIGYGVFSFFDLPGRWGLIWVGAAMASFLLFGRRVSSTWIFRLYKARPLERHAAPQLVALIEDLSRHAGLERSPRLYYLPSKMINAFAAGTPHDAGIGVTDGILRTLELRELAGVLAHEITHLVNRDLTAMGLADVTSRIANTVSWLGQLMLLFNLPLYMMGSRPFPWLIVLLMILAPTMSALLQLALSRTREFNADLGAVRLTGDPRGLASALAKMERLQGGFVERVFMPGRRVPEPSLLRTHPDTNERVRRLLELEGIEYEPPPAAEPVADSLERIPIVVQRRPRWHMSGLWY